MTEATLAEDIRRHALDDRADELCDLLLAVTRAKLAISNPKRLTS
ncbi:hypothetical protein GCM10027040_29660 [Halomonas shantousis]